MSLDSLFLISTDQICLVHLLMNDVNKQYKHLNSNLPAYRKESKGAQGCVIGEHNKITMQEACARITEIPGQRKSQVKTNSLVIKSDCGDINKNPEHFSYFDDIQYLSATSFCKTVNFLNCKQPHLQTWCFLENVFFLQIHALCRILLTHL